MTFQEQLDVVVRDYWYLNEKASYYEDFQASFVANVRENTPILLSKITELKDQMWMWSFVDFVQEKLESKVISDEFYSVIRDWSHNILLDPATGKEVRTHIIDVFFFIESDKKVIKEAVWIILKNYQRYVILERLTVRLKEKVHLFPEEFVKSLLETLNVDRERFIGITWLKELFWLLAKSEYLSLFIEKIQKPEYKTALEEFVDMWETSSNEFFSSVPKDSRNIVLDFLLNLFQPYSSDDMRSILFDSLVGHSIWEFRNRALEFIVENTDSLVDFLWEVLSHYIWDLYPFVSKYISPSDVAKLPKYIEMQKIFWLYEASLQQTQREDLQILKIAFFELPGFEEKMIEIEQARKENDEKFKESQRQRDKEIKAQIEHASTNIPENQINPGLIDLFERYKNSNDVDWNPYFSEQKKQVVKQFLDTFFSWNLFPVNSLEIEEIQNQDGNKQHRGWPWYAHGFFSLAVRISKEDFWFDPIPQIKKESLINALPLLYSDDLDKFIFPHLKTITAKQANIILSFYDGSRKDDLMYFWSGQNFFPIIEKYKKTLVSKTVIDHFRRTLQYWIENDRLYEWNRSEAVRKIGEKDTVNEEILNYLADLFEREKHILPENVLANFSRELSYLIAVNQVLIEHGDDKAIRWRINQIKDAKIAMRDPWANFSWKYARSIWDLEDELTHGDKSFVSALKNIDVKEYKTEILELIRTIFDLLDEDEELYSIFWRYVLSWIKIILWNNSSNEDLLKSIKRLLHKNTNKVKHIVNYYL